MMGEFFTVSELADMFEVDRSTVYRYIKYGCDGVILPASTINGKVVVHKNDAANFVDELYNMSIMGKFNSKFSVALRNNNQNYFDY